MQPEKAIDAVTDFIKSNAFYATIDHAMDDNWIWQTFTRKKFPEISGSGFAAFKNRDWMAYITYPIVPFPEYRIEMRAGHEYMFIFKVNNRFRITEFKRITLMDDEN